jgi:hypothetical protein
MEEFMRSGWPPGSGPEGSGKAKVRTLIACAAERRDVSDFGLAREYWSDSAGATRSCKTRRHTHGGVDCSDSSGEFSEVQEWRMRRRADQLICGGLGDMDGVDGEDDGCARSGLSADNIVWKKSSCRLRRQRRHEYDSRMPGRPDCQALSRMMSARAEEAKGLESGSFTSHRGLTMRACLFPATMRLGPGGVSESP